MDEVAATVLRTCTTAGWAGDVWRVHSQRYSATDPGGSLRAQGRWHRGGRMFPADQAFATLYTAVSDAVATWEYIRHSRLDSADEMWLRFSTVVLSKLRVQLASVLDLRDPPPGLLAVSALTSEDYTLTQAIGATAFMHGLEGLLVPSATGVGEWGAEYNVVIFTDNLRPTSRIMLVESRTPNLPP